MVIRDSASVSDQTAVLHGLGGFVVQVAHQLVRIAIERNQHALSHHDGRVVRNGVESFQLISPPVAERGRAGAVGGDLLGHFVAFEDMLQRADLEAVVVRHAQQHQDFVGAIAMRVHQAFAFQHFHQRLQLEIAARRDGLLATRGLLRCNPSRIAGMPWPR